MSIRERLDTLSRGELTGLIVVVVVVLAGAGLWYSRSLPKPVQISAPTPGPAVVSPSAEPSQVPIIVDITGLVRRPGVYQFASGDRVIDAVERAGGAKPNADLSVLNLAAPLTDGTQVVVPKAGAAPAGTVVSPGGTATGTTPGALININTAGETELETLTGVGPVTAEAIVQYRTENGPFATVDDLEDVSGIGPATLEEIRPFVTV